MRNRFEVIILCLVALSSQNAGHAQGLPYPPKQNPFEAFAVKSAMGLGKIGEKGSSPNLVCQIGADFKNVFTRKENLMIVALGLGAAWGASYFDDRIASGGLNSELNEETPLDHFFEAGHFLGGALVQVGGALVPYALGKLLSKPGVENLGRDLVRSLVVTQSLTFAIKFAVGRERPNGSDKRSFPSGHASGTFATATVLQRRYGWKAGIPAYAVAGYVAISRLNEGQHFLSDIVFGAALGLMVGRTVTIDLAKSRFSVSPMPTPDGFGVRLTWHDFGRDFR
jgi:membrane-associated phospholipid phosphatase